MDTERKVEQQADHGLKKMTALQEKSQKSKAENFGSIPGNFDEVNFLSYNKVKEIEGKI
ncbi:hypothetical protein [Holdemania massiliensis]|uniref:hypothetical protein n=1 Tax=Holdemania massiliensis TaxID=1468449 RepID=UPI002674DAAC|nr:hypothetical protein [Holdemania massiliensis]